MTTMSDDLISRLAAIDAILRLTTFASVRELYEYVQEHNLTEMWCGGINDAIDAVIAVPSAQPEQRWIPCSERLPEEDGLYIVACGFHGEHSTFAYWNGDYWSIKTPVIAWMPGIEPYKMSEEEIHEDDMRMNYTLDLREVIKAGLIKNGGLND